MPEKLKKGVFYKLALIQSEIKVAKKRYNKFGGFYYRSLEDIFEELKPILNTYNVSIFVSDDIAVVDGRIYVKASAYLVDLETNEKIQVSAFAREPDMKKGMDASQITGAASSYARKYALAGLLLLDDNQDADAEEPQQQPQTTTNNHNEPQNSNSKFDKQKFLEQVNKIIEQKKIPPALIEMFLKSYNLNSFEEVNDKDTAIDIYIKLKNVKVEKVKEENNEKKGSKDK